MIGLSRTALFLSFMLVFACQSQKSESDLDAGNTNEDASSSQLDGSTNNDGSSSYSANLSNLTVSPGTLDPVFSPQTLNYNVDIASDVMSITVTPTPEDPLATMTVQNATISSPVVSPTAAEPAVEVDVPLRNNSIVVQVISADGINSRSYTISVRKATGPIVVNHSTLNISLIPDAVMELVKQHVLWSYEHTSHGRQLTAGLVLLAEPAGSRYSVFIDEVVPQNNPTELTIYDRPQVSRTDFIGDPGRVISMLNDPAYGAINFWGFMWCDDMGSEWLRDQGMLEGYLQTMVDLEAAYPAGDVKFIYFTAPADEVDWVQDPYTDDWHVLRYDGNEQIRAHVVDHPEQNRILFDFADIECWLYDGDGNATSQCTRNIGGVDIPIRCTEYNDPDLITHTTPANQISKGRAVWWLFALLVGWDG